MSDGDCGSENDPSVAASDVILRLPATLREDLRRPLGPIQQTVSGVPTDAPVIAVGDIVAYHLSQAGRRPSVAVVDRRTQREAVDPAVADAVLDDDRRQVAVENPAGTITAPLVNAIVDAIADPDPVVVVVQGEEDLAVLPAVLAAPTGATVLYGQPEEGLVQVTVDDDARATVRDLLARMDGPMERLSALLEG